MLPILRIIILFLNGAATILTIVVTATTGLMQTHGVEVGPFRNCIDGFSWAGMHTTQDCTTMGNQCLLHNGLQAFSASNTCDLIIVVQAMLIITLILGFIPWIYVLIAQCCSSVDRTIQKSISISTMEKITICLCGCAWVTSVIALICTARAGANESGYTFSYGFVLLCMSTFLRLFVFIFSICFKERSQPTPHTRSMNTRQQARRTHQTQDSDPSQEPDTQELNKLPASVTFEPTYMAPSAPVSSACEPEHHHHHHHHHHHDHHHAAPSYDPPTYEPHHDHATHISTISSYEPPTTTSYDAPSFQSCHVDTHSHSHV